MKGTIKLLATKTAKSKLHKKNSRPDIFIPWPAAHSSTKPKPKTTIFFINQVPFYLIKLKFF